MFPAVRLMKLDKVYPVGYTICDDGNTQTENFAKWINGLRDIRARARVLARVQRLACGNLEMSNQLAREYRKCGLTMDPNIGFTTRGRENT